MRKIFSVVVLALFLTGCAAMPRALPPEPSVKAMMMRSPAGPVVVMPASDFLMILDYIKALKKETERRW